ncbi:MAG: 6-bladed beta-propeller [Bacteroidetes bacterium]|nr:MAG: 6-bladed beta-propeller [Bacteroidota bacterium]
MYNFVMKTFFTLISIIWSLALSGQVQSTAPGSTRNDDPFIKWIATIPGSDAGNTTGFIEMVFNFIVGSDPVEYNNPVNVFADGIQNFLIVNQGNGNILQYLNGKTLLLPAFKHEQSKFPSLVGICSVKSEGILFTDSKLNEVYFLSNDGKHLRIFNDTNSLVRPTGIAYSEMNDEIWVVETGSHQISVFDRNGGRKKIIGRRGNGQLEFNFPTYIWIDSSGRIYIVDSMNFRVQVLSTSGAFISSFGKQGDATGYFARPRGVATDSQGNIYVADALFNAVQIFDGSGKLLYYFGSQGSDKYQFWMPSGIFIDKNDYIYVSDSYNGRVQVFQLVKNNQK